MSTAIHYQTAPGDRVPIWQKLAYGSGAMTNNILGAALGYMSIVLNIGYGMNPAAIGLLLALPRLMDALIDPIMGHISDNTMSRFGRRRPYIFWGAISVGIVFAVMWQLPREQAESFYFWAFLTGSLFFYLAYTVFAAPFVALGYEMTPDYHERTRLQGVGNFMGQIGFFIVPWLYAIMENDRWFKDSIDGSRSLAIILGGLCIGLGVLPALFCKERFNTTPAVPREQQGAKRVFAEFFKAFATTIRCRPFLKLCVATFFLFNGLMLVGSFGSYINIFYVCAGNTDMGAEYMGLFGTLSSITVFLTIPAVTWISKKLGKKNTFILTSCITLLGCLMKWPCYNPELPWLILLPAPFISVGMGALFTLMGSMTADVCDLDELATGQRREGMFGAVFWWVVKLGMAMSFALSGWLLNKTGFDVALKGAQSMHTFFMMRLCDVLIPALTSLLAILTMLTFAINEQKAHEVRQELEQRRKNQSAL